MQKAVAGVLRFSLVGLLVMHLPRLAVAQSCDAEIVEESFPPLTAVDAQALAFDPADDMDSSVDYKFEGCFPKPVVLFVGACDLDEFTLYCCSPSPTGFTLSKFEVFDRTELTWVASATGGFGSNPGAFLASDGMMVQTVSNGGTDWDGNEYVIYYPPLDLPLWYFFQSS